MMKTFESKFVSYSLTFDDVLLLPGYSEVIPSEVDVTTCFAGDIKLSIPLCSSAMDTVTESRLAIALAQEGGIGVIHKNMTIDEQAAEVDRVKRSESGMIVDPITLGPNQRIGEALQLMARFHISGIPITENGKLVGILTNRDLRFVNDTEVLIREYMTKKNLVTAKVGTTLEEAEEELHQHRIEKLPVVDDEGYLKGLITIKDIERFKAILSNDALVLDIIKQETQDIKERYGDKRRTEIIRNVQDIDIEDLIVDEDMVITLSHAGYIKRNPISLYRAQRRGGKGVSGTKTREEDFVVSMVIGSTHDYLLFFMNTGRLHWRRLHEIPEAGRVAKGTAVINLLNLQPEEYIATILSIKSFEEGKYVVMATKNGLVKKTKLPDSNPFSNTILAEGMPRASAVARTIALGSEIPKSAALRSSRIFDLWRESSVFPIV